MKSYDISPQPALTTLTPNPSTTEKSTQWDAKREDANGPN
jgi:hypothetical protein